MIRQATRCEIIAALPGRVDEGQWFNRSRIVSHAAGGLPLIG